LPSLNHSLIQMNLGTELRNRYKKVYSIASELSLDLANWSSVPDIRHFPPLFEKIVFSILGSK